MLATSPYLVIQANAAFLRYTGSVSSVVLGRPLRDLIQDESILDVLAESSNTFTTPPIRTTSIFKVNNSCKNTDNTTGDNETTENGYKLVISPVGSPNTSITHFAIELEITSTNQEECNNQGQRGTKSYDQPFDGNSSQSAMNVIG